MTHKKRYLIDLKIGDFFIVGSRTCIVLCTRIVSYGFDKEYLELLVLDCGNLRKAAKTTIDNWTFVLYDARHVELSKKERFLNE